MQKIIIPFSKEEEIGSMAILNQRLDSLQKQTIDNAPWPAFPYQPSVSFSISYSHTSILLKYFVDEKMVRAAAGKTGGNVWEDACVEFFISFDEAGYYNIEFNCIGTGLVGFGKGKESRMMLPIDVIQKIEFSCALHNNSGTIHWELTLKIPLTIFTFHHLTSLKGQTCRANFYKCGDELEEPHFLSWSPISSPEPNFHLPQFFGKLFFE
ncbi:MAG: carbohydrate-binding family 9-like protein [Chitinophagaceae bacterium]